MPELDHARRQLLQATYTPIKVVAGIGIPSPKRGWEKRRFIGLLNPSTAEIDAAAGMFPAAEDQSPSDSAFQDALAAIKGMVAPGEAGAIQRNVAQFASVEADALIRIAECVAQSRAQQVGGLLQALKTIREALEREASAPTSTVDTGIAGRANPPQAIVTRCSCFQPTLCMLLQWALRNEAETAMAKKGLDLAARLSLPQSATLADLDAAAQAHIDSTHTIVAASTVQLATEPVGLLHLERLTFTPAGIERGALVYSLPMAPAEEVNIIHKEWSDTSEEFEKIVTDYQEGFSEEGVAEKSEAVTATSSQIQHTSGFNTGVTASGGYGPVNIVASASYGVSDAAAQSELSSINHSIAVTRKASARTKKEKKITFKVTSASGTEDQAVRRIKNPSQDQTLRLDYYELIRKWMIHHYRYGIRLTYDLAVPEPGAGILSKIKEIETIRSALEEGFGSADATHPWAQFDLTPAQVTRDNYPALAAQYGGAVTSPPQSSILVDIVEKRDWSSEAQAEYYQLTRFDVTVPAEYQVTGVSVWGWRGTYGPDEKFDFNNLVNTNAWKGQSGTFRYIVGSQHLSSFAVHVQVTAALRDEAFRAWQQTAWSALRDAAQARYLEQRQLLKGKLEELTAALGAQDALSLRKIEREEVMKGVLAWLFGPKFTFVPKGLPIDLTDASGTVISEAIHSTVLAKGEIIKFLHHAIEWENMVYFLYPYFWSHPTRWEFKKYLDHPDAMHRTFLKAGSARVVLTIRPGYESDFVAFLETGAFDPLPANHPYLTIAKEIEAYAKTNYPGIPPANPEEANEKERGKLIGTWYEYTPTNALDIAIGDTLPSA